MYLRALRLANKDLWQMGITPSLSREYLLLVVFLMVSYLPGHLFFIPGFNDKIFYITNLTFSIYLSKSLISCNDANLISTANSFCMFVFVLLLTFSTLTFIYKSRSWIPLHCSAVLMQRRVCRCCYCNHSRISSSDQSISRNWQKCIS